MNEENNKKNLRYLFKRKGKSKRGYSKKYSLLKERELKEILIKTDHTCCLPSSKRIQKFIS